MKILAALVLPLAVLSSCSSVPEQMVGSYKATPGDRGISEWIAVEKDGMMTWHHEAKGWPVNQSLGFVRTSGGKPETARLAFMATSPFIGTGISFSPDCSRLKVDWQEWALDQRRRSTDFVKKPAAH